MNVSRSLLCSLTMALLSYLMVNSLSADSTGSSDVPSSLLNYEFCTVSQIKTQHGYSAVLVNLLDSTYRGPDSTDAQTSGLVYKGYIGRISPTHFVCPALDPKPSTNLTESTSGDTVCNRKTGNPNKCPGFDSDGPCLDGDWVIVDRSLTRWCRTNQCGSLTQLERDSLTVLCNTPDVVHSFVPAKDISRLPAYNVSQGLFHPRAARLCSVPWNIPKPDNKTVTRNLTGMYFPAGPLADPYSGDDLSAAEKCWPFYVDGGLHFFTWLDVNDYDLQVSSEASFLIAQKRDKPGTEDLACGPSANHQWQQPDSTLGTIFVDDVNPETLTAPQSSQSNYTPPEGALPASEVNVLTEYPRTEINYCEQVSGNQKERFAGIEFPEIKIAIVATGGAKPIIKSSLAGCKLMQPEGNQHKVVSVALPNGSPSGPDDAQRGYERMTIPTTYGWMSSARYTDQNRAGCVARELSANPYNLCRFDDPDLAERKLYGILEDGSDICQAVALTYDKALDFKYIIKTASAFEVFDFTAEPPPPPAVTAPDSALFNSASISVYMVTVILTLANIL